MKTIATCALLAVLGGCGTYSTEREVKAPDVTQVARVSFTSIHAVIIDDHLYLIAEGWGSHGLAMLHAESCACKQVKP